MLAIEERRLAPLGGPHSTQSIEFRKTLRVLLRHGDESNRPDGGDGSRLAPPSEGGAKNDAGLGLWIVVLLRLGCTLTRGWVHESKA